MARDMFREYTAYLSEGEINVYYDCCGVKSLLF